MNNDNSGDSNDQIQSSLQRSPELLRASQSQLLIVDVQDKLLPVIEGREGVLEGCRYLLETARVLNVPVFVSEQYPQGLGGTVSELRDLVKAGEYFSKLRFSAADEFLARANPDERHQVVIAGIEAHICVLQTALDLLANGFRTYVVEDAVSSRNVADVAVALNRIRDAGGIVIRSESVAFEWCEVAGTDEFRAVSRMTRNRTRID